jgi:hypothetical protein
MLAVGAAVLVTLIWIRAARAALLKISFTSISLFVISASAIAGIIVVLAWWYVPMGRRPHRVPMWNDQYHRQGARAARAICVAISTGVAMAAISWLGVTAQLPNMNTPGTIVIAGGVVTQISGGTWRCRATLTLEAGPERLHICACPRGDCVKGYDDGISIGKRIDLEVSENWAGTVIVGLVEHGI